MDPIVKFSDRATRFRSGRGASRSSTFLTTNFAWFFDSSRAGLTFILEGIVARLLLVSAAHPVAAIAALAWYLQKSWQLAAVVALGLLFIINQGLWKETVETLVLVVAATAASMAIGVPLGIWAAHKPRIYRVHASQSST